MSWLLNTISVRVDLVSVLGLDSFICVTFSHICFNEYSFSNFCYDSSLLLFLYY